MAHNSRLTRELRLLPHTQRVAALGTLNDDGSPLVSMVPYALESGLACLVIHVSGLAAHTRNLQAAAASVLADRDRNDFHGLVLHPYLRRAGIPGHKAP